jgi:Thioredoxin domain
MVGTPTSAAVDLQVLYVEGCANTPATIEMIRQVAASLGIQIDLSMVLVKTAQQAHEMRFLGSPTVLVNGLDMDPSARHSTAFGFM